jgi:hypothetical protein
VVETGTPIFEGPKTIMPVIRLAVKAWPNSISVIRFPYGQKSQNQALKYGETQPPDFQKQI